MANAQGLVTAAGGIAFVGSFKEAGGIPSNGLAIAGGTFGLILVFAAVQATPLAPATKALAALMLLGSVYRYVPGLFNTKRKGK